MQLYVAVAQMTQLDRALAGIAFTDSAQGKCREVQTLSGMQVCEDARRLLRGGSQAGHCSLVEALDGALLGAPWPLQQPLELLEHRW